MRRMLAWWSVWFQASRNWVEGSMTCGSKSIVSPFGNVFACTSCELSA